MASVTSKAGDGDFRAAFAAHEQQARLNTGRVAAVLVAVLMPFGASLDFEVYKPQWEFFLILRLGCAVLAGVIWFLLGQPFGQRHHRPLGYLTALLPAFFITWMIYHQDIPAESPYYAGLNLIILAISLVVRWSAWESLLVVVCMILMYVAACVIKGPPEALNGDWVANCIFMVETGVIVVVGNHFFNRLRFREFVSRFELNERKRELEEAIRKLREAEAQLVQQEKMASLGVMSAGIIHEINNPLNFAATGLFTLRKKGKHLAADQQGDYQEILTDIEEGINRVKTIVSDLRLFTHPDTGSMDEVDLEEALTSALRFLASELKDDIRLEWTFPPGLTVCANKNKLIHVLTNLVQNSLDALRRKTFDGEQPTIRIEGRPGPDRVWVTVRDNGPGITPENQHKIFDPFYTTKDVGEGMGLGLSICYRLMQEFNGEIKVDSQPDRYCQFTLEFPVRKPNGTTV
jgi:two-component system sensor histidine kinase PhcS